MMSDLLTNHRSSNTRVVKDENNLVRVCMCVYECLGELPPGTEQLFTHQLTYE